MANPAKGEVGHIVDGKAYTLRPTFDAICELEELVGKPIDDITRTIQEGRRSGIRAFVWCCLQEHHSGEIKTLKDASRWIERVGADVVFGLCERVLGVNAEPQDATTGGETANPPDAQAGTGENSLPEPVVSV